MPFVRLNESDTDSSRFRVDFERKGDVAPTDLIPPQSGSRSNCL